MSPGELDLGPGDDALEELHLRVALSTLAPMAAVQQVNLTLTSGADGMVVTETPRAGVFDAPLLPRFQKLVALLAELEIRHVDFGDITNPPPGFDPGDYPERYGGLPTVANYLFYPQPATMVTSVVIGG